MQDFNLSESYSAMVSFLENGGPSIWAIFALSIILLTVIFWKLWRFTLCGVWAPFGKSRRLFENDIASSISKHGVQTAREDVERMAKNKLAEHSSGFRLLELIATIAPLLGLLGTVLGMIAAFQALQNSGNDADPSVLAGGIWEALLTTAAGMAVAIPASVSLTWFESVVDKLRLDYEDIATRTLLHRGVPVGQLHAAE